MTTGAPPKRFHFTGWHMLAILVVFFGGIMVVNGYMAHLATSTFTGEVSDNGYVASQSFNHWLDEAAREKALGWNAVVARQADGRLVVTVTGKGTDDAILSGEAARPLGTGEAVISKIAFARQAGGSFVSNAKLADGRWRLRLTITAGGHQWHSLDVI
jgi:nitrogen fixation protein FixH